MYTPASNPYQSKKVVSQNSRPTAAAPALFYHRPYSKVKNRYAYPLVEDRLRHRGLRHQPRKTPGSCRAHNWRGTLSQHYYAYYTSLTTLCFFQQAIFASSWATLRSFTPICAQVSTSLAILRILALVRVHIWVCVSISNVMPCKPERSSIV